MAGPHTPDSSQSPQARDARERALAEMAKHRDALIAQCPPLPSLSDEEAAKLPIHVTRWGTTGSRVLIIHGGVQGGLGGGPKTFVKQEALALDPWRIELVDRPGFGLSPTRGADDMERDAVWIADMLGEGAHLCGHSWGGAEALLAAARRPDDVRSLILIEPALPAVAEADPRLRDDPAVRKGMLERGRMLMNAATPAEYGVAFARSMGTAPEGGDRPNAVATALDADPAQAARVGCALLRGRMASGEAVTRAIEIVRRAAIPTLIVTGGWSQSFDVGGRVLAELLHGRPVIVPSPNHFVQLANAEAFNKVVTAFMREADQRRTP
jgi:pimeloyl-ACP methyl ester carboxylesterase